MIRLFRSFDLFFGICSLFFFIFPLIFVFNFWSLNFGYISFSFFMNDMFSKIFETFFYSKFVNSLMFIVGLVIFSFNFFSVFMYNFAFTSQLSLCFLFRFVLWSSSVIYIIIFSSNKFLSHLIPEGCPLILIFFLFAIEVISNLIRPLTLTVRLLANIVSGHLLLRMLGNFCLQYFYFSFSFLILHSVEFFVSLIQSYIFVTLLIIYYNEIFSH